MLASGATAIAGFAALIASDIRMLRDFGIVTVVDLTVSLLGVMLVLPAALLWAEEHGPFRVRDLDPRPAARLRRGARRRAPLGGRRSARPRRESATRPSATHAPRAACPEVPRPGNKYAWLVGILAFMGLGVLLFDQTLPNSGEGLNGPAPRLAAEGLRRALRARRPRGRRERLPAQALPEARRRRAGLRGALARRW